jgi:hypothetical protein
MKKLLLVPVLLFAACADTPAHEEDQLNAEGDMAEPEGPATPGTPDTPGTSPVPLRVGFITEPSSCADRSVWIEGHWSYADGSRPDQVDCRYELLDGTLLSTNCATVAPLPDGDIVVFTVTDPATGAVASYQGFAQGPQSFATSVTVSTDGLSLSWDAETMYGTTADVGGVRISISPSANVIAPDASVFMSPTGTVSVTEAGTYTVHVDGFITFAEVGGCSASADATVDVMCDDPTHEH